MRHQRKRSAHSPYLGAESIKKIAINNCCAEFDVLDDLHLVRITVSGDLDRLALDKTIVVGRNLSGGKASNRKYNFRACNLSLTFYDLYVFLRTEASTQSIRIKIVKVAILISKNRDFRRYSFYETPAQNVGLNI